MSKSQKMLSLIDEGTLYKHGGYVFTMSHIDKDKIYGTVAYKGKAYSGYISYSDESGIGWKFTNDFPVEASEDDDWLDLCTDVVMANNNALETD